ncbi:MAG: hypothetical protein JXA36_03395 [Coriobacteriia bacterium]|nr:hypothetical protein [Coriobacteriia bacterium]
MSLGYVRKRLARRTRKALITALGSAGVGTIASIVLLGIALGWFGDALWELLPESEQIAIGLFVFPALMVVLVLIARFGDVMPPLRFRQDHELTRRRAIIMFLSPPATGDTEMRRKLEQGLVFAEGDDVRDRAVRDKFDTSPWRMCAEAIAHHCGTLEYVYALSSADSVDSRGAVRNEGTYRYADLFVGVFKGTAESGGLLPADRAIEVLVTPSPGIDQENAEQLGSELERIVRELADRGIPEKDIIVDVTGGSKVWSAVAGIVALGESRAFQYVSRDDYRVHVYDISPDQD